MAGTTGISDSKLHDVLLAFAVARCWPDVLSNAMEPGWVATKMGGPGAPDNLDAAHRTQVWLVASDDPAATVTGSTSITCGSVHPTQCLAMWNGRKHYSMPVSTSPEWICPQINVFPG